MVLLAGLAVVVGATGVLSLVGRLPGNDYLGVRTPETRRAPQAWDLANRAAAPAFLAAGLVLGLGVLGAGLIGGWVGAGVVVVALVGALVLLNVAGLAGSRAAAIWQAHNDDDDAGCGCADGACGGGEHSGGSTGDAAVNCSSPTTDDAGDPAADCGVTGGCGSCLLHGMCAPENVGR